MEDENLWKMILCGHYLEQTLLLEGEKESKLLRVW